MCYVILCEKSFCIYLRAEMGDWLASDLDRPLSTHSLKGNDGRQWRIWWERAHCRHKIFYLLLTHTHTHCCSLTRVPLQNPFVIRAVFPIASNRYVASPSSLVLHEMVVVMSGIYDDIIKNMKSLPIHWMQYTSYSSLFASVPLYNGCSLRNKDSVWSFRAFESYQPDFACASTVESIWLFRAVSINPSDEWTPKFSKSTDPLLFAIRSASASSVSMLRKMKCGDCLI